MDFQFTELQMSVQRMMKDFVNREVIPIAMEYELADKYPTPAVEKMQELGFFRLHDTRGIRRKRHGRGVLRHRHGGAVRGLDERGGHPGYAHDDRLDDSELRDG